MIGELLDGRYEITRKIGAGGMGAVFEAVHTGTGRRVAVKLIIAEDLTKKTDTIKRFQREARAAGSIDTKHICAVLDTGTDPKTGRPFMVMELMEGEDLAKLLKRVGPLPPEVALAIAAQACRGLQKAHDATVVHRDIKPGNLFLSEKDDEVVVKLLDFGIAKMQSPALSLSESTLTQAGALLGSPLYMSPEQARGKGTIDHRSDIYSLGAVVYKMFCGRLPFQDVEAFGDLIISICSSPVPPIQDFAPWLPPEYAEVVHRCLRSHPDDRFQSASEALNAITELLPGGVLLSKAQLTGLAEQQRQQVAEKALVVDERIISGTQTGLAHTQHVPEPTSRTPVLVAAAAVIALCGVGIYKLTTATSHPQHAPAGSNTAPLDSSAIMQPNPQELDASPTAPATTTSASATATQSASTSTSKTPRVGPQPRAWPTATKSATPTKTPTGDDDDFGGRK